MMTKQILMKILLSFLFYGVMVGTTATVGTGMEVANTENKSAGPAKTINTPKEVITKPVLNSNTATKNFKAFAVRQKRNEVVITWAASSEEINQFVVEESTDGKSFKPLNNLNATNAIAYKYCVAQNLSLKYYRIAALKISGDIEYSAARKSRS